MALLTAGAYDAALYARARHEATPTGELFRPRTPAGLAPLTPEQQRHNLTLLMEAVYPRQSDPQLEQQRSPVRALTIRPPWSDCCAIEDDDLGKRIENRTWRTSWRGTLLIHAGLQVDTKALTLPVVRKTLPEDYKPVRRGVVVAIADLTGIHMDDGVCTPWSEREKYHWQLANVQRLTEPVKATGALSLWTPGPELLDEIAAANPHAAARLTAALAAA